MNEKTKKTSAEESEQEAQEARRQYWRRVRRRFVGAAAVALLIGLLWQLGGNPRAPKISPAPLPESAWEPLAPAEELADVAEDLDDTDDILNFPEIFPGAEEENLSGGEVDSSSGEETSNGEESNAANAAANAAPGEEEIPAAEQSVPENENAVADGSDSDSAVEIKTEIETETETEIEPETATDADAPFVVQIGAFQHNAKARRAEEKLRANNYKVAVEKITIEGVPIVRVRAAGYRTRAEAELARRKLAELGYRNAQVLDTR